MTLNHIPKYALITERQPRMSAFRWRHYDAVNRALITAGILVLIAGIAIVTYIMRHPVAL